MFVRLFLALSALVWVPYGLFCFFRPEYLSEAAGVASASPTGTLELRAMYGGLQAAFGVLAGLAVFRPPLRRPALVTLAFATGGLFIARLGGIGIGTEMSGYTAGALAFELVSTAIAIWLLRSDPELALPT